MSLGKNIAARRKELHKTQAQMAEAAKMTLSAYVKFEYDKRVPRLWTFVRIKNALKISADKLLDGVQPEGLETVAVERRARR